MGVTNGVSLAERIPDGATVLIDTNPLVYWFEGSELAVPFEPVFADIEAGRIDAVVTPITVAEVVSGPLRAGQDALAERYRQAITAGQGFSVRDTNADIAVLAARLRIRHRLKLPDAIQLATCVQAGCFALLTRDRDFGSVTDVLVLGPG
jgi:predicted nucleic acid-binding protein